MSIQPCPLMLHTRQTTNDFFSQTYRLVRSQNPQVYAGVLVEDQTLNGKSCDVTEMLLVSSLAEHRSKLSTESSHWPLCYKGWKRGVWMWRLFSCQTCCRPASSLENKMSVFVLPRHEKNMTVWRCTTSRGSKVHRLRESSWGGGQRRFTRLRQHTWLDSIVKTKVNLSGLANKCHYLVQMWCFKNPKHFTTQ